MGASQRGYFRSVPKEWGRGEWGNSDICASREEISLAKPCLGTIIVPPFEG